MTAELHWLSLTALVVALYWVPYILNRMASQGILEAMRNTAENETQPAAWARRAQAAHGVAMENFPLFAALILAAHVAGVSNGVTAAAAPLYFFGMLAHYIVFTLGIPYLRTLAFLIAGFGAEMALALTLLGII